MSGASPGASAMRGLHEGGGGAGAAPDARRRHAGLSGADGEGASRVCRGAGGSGPGASNGGLADSSCLGRSHRSADGASARAESSGSAGGEGDEGGRCAGRRPLAGGYVRGFYTGRTRFLSGELGASRVPGCSVLRHELADGCSAPARGGRHPIGGPTAERAQGGDHSNRDGPPYCEIRADRGKEDCMHGRAGRSWPWRGQGYAAGRPLLGRARGAADEAGSAREGAVDRGFFPWRGRARQQGGG
mmetsp:Transcript_24806/g.70606  ORF Transcript_24806/g.70606 Transcript_24806/m.70606 type:complete len:245 (-) Transcript_24806:439-1173(-)